MDPQFWLTHWETQDRHGFHQDRVHADLPRFETTFLGGGPHRVLVPLCGKSVDLDWLVAAGHEVVGIELSPIAIQEIFHRLGARPTEDALGPFRRFRIGRATVLCGDVFAATPELLGEFDRVWDRAALVALDAPRRGPYTAGLRALLRPGGRLLQNTFVYEQSVMDGPPWSVPEDELRKHYRGWAMRHLARDVLTEGKFIDRGLKRWTVDRWLLEKPN